MTIAAASTQVLDFNPVVGMLVEGAPPENPESDPWRVTMTFAPGFAGPPVHVHPHQEESYEVHNGVLDVFVDERWRELRPGETLTVPAGTPHTIRNLHAEELVAVNVHTPALEFPRYMACLHELVHSGKVRALPPKDPRSMIYLSMLFTEHARTLASVKPPQRLMRVLASVGRRLGYKLPTTSRDSRIVDPEADMSRADHEIRNPRTGQRMRFLRTAADTDGELLQIETVNPPTGVPEPVHVHPRQESRVEVIAGTLRFVVDGEERLLGPGDTITIPAGRPHQFVNDGEEDAVAVGDFRPALRTAEFFEVLFDLAERDELDENGMPSLLRLAVLAPAFSEEIRVVSPPWPVQRLAFALLAPIARLRGYTTP